MAAAVADIPFEWQTITVMLPAGTAVDPGNTILFHYAIELNPGYTTTTLGTNTGTIGAGSTTGGSTL